MVGRYSVSISDAVTICNFLCSCDVTSCNSLNILLRQEAVIGRTGYLTDVAVLVL